MSTARRERPNENGGGKNSGRWLAAVPVAVALTLGFLIVPRAVPPRDVPLPVVDAAALARTHESDAARVRAAEAEPLPREVRALGAAIRAFNTAEEANTPDAAWDVLRANIDRARREALPLGVGPLLSLRAVQGDRFVAALHEWEHGAPPSAELAATGGGFLQRFAAVGWVHDRRVELDDDALRVAFKLKWNVVAGVDGVSDFEPTLNESRALYAFYLGHPHPPEQTKRSIDAARVTAKSREDCDALDSGEAMASEGWRAEKIKALGRIDAAYPTEFALGVAEYRAGRYEASARAFDAWIDAHPDGPLTLRARNHLRAAMAEGR